MYVCMYVYVCMSVHVCVCVFVCVVVCLYLRMRVCILLFVCVCAFVYVSMSVGVCVCVEPPIGGQICNVWAVQGAAAEGQLESEMNCRPTRCGKPCMRHELCSPNQDCRLPSGFDFLLFLEKPLTKLMAP